MKYVNPIANVSKLFLTWMVIFAKPTVLTATDYLMQLTSASLQHLKSFQTQNRRAGKSDPGTAEQLQCPGQIPVALAHLRENAEKIGDSKCQMLLP